MRHRLDLLRRGTLVHSAFYNYALHFSRFILPLIIMPYLSRVLLPDAYGRVFLATSFGVMLSLIIEFGFSFSATRELARRRDDAGQIARVCASVLSAKIMLTAVAVIVGAAMALWLPRFQPIQSFAWIGIGYAVASGLSPMWYYQAIEKMRVQSALEIGAQLAAMLFVFLFVHGPQDALIVLLLQTAGAVVSTGAGYALLYRKTAFLKPTLDAGIAALRMGWTVFLFRASVTLFTTANVFLVGLLLPASQTAYYGTAEKLFSAFAGLFAPLAMTIFPRTNYLLATEPHKALQLVRNGFILVAGASIVAVAGLWILSPVMIAILFGRGFEPSAPIAEILALAIPAIAANTILGSQCMLALHMDKPFNRIIYSAGTLTVLSAFALVPIYGALSMAAIRVGAECFITLAMILYLWTHRADVKARLRV